MDNILDIAIIQTGLIWESPLKNRVSLEKKIELVQENVDLIVLPEMFTTGFTMTPHHIDNKEGPLTLQWMQKMASNKMAAITGSIVFSSDEKFVNRLYFVKPDGTYEFYDKRHTFTLAGENKVYEAGKNSVIVDYKGFKICPLICYDLRFPVWSRNTTNYDILLYVANWPKPRIKAWDALLKARAIENMSYVIGANRVGLDNANYEYTGHSGVYDYLGEQLVFSDQETILYTSLNKSNMMETREKLKFLEDQDSFLFQ